ncbi:MAG: hypothetical protein Q9194_003533 [Teloschistes cf. exilis]
MNLPVDLSFTKALPKVELHAHLSGSISRECLHDLWIEACREQPGLTLEDPAIVLPSDKVDFDVMAFFPLFNTYIYAFVNSIPAVIVSTDSVLNDFAADGVVYLELRTTPRSCPGFTKEQYVTAILKCISAHNVRQAEMRTRLILSIDRKHATAEVAEIIDMAIRYRSRGVVGVDLCGDPSRPINLIMLQREFARAKAAGLGVTLHFAEIAASSSLVELEGLLAMRPDRLGHVIHVDGEVKEEIAARKTGLELCLSCNRDPASLVEAVVCASGYRCRVRFRDQTKSCDDYARVVMERSHIDGRLQKAIYHRESPNTVKLNPFVFLIMYLIVLGSFLLSYLPFARAAQVGIGAMAAGERVMQVCALKKNAPDVCCIPIDLDLQDDRGYGWFKPDSVAFEGLISPYTFTAVYADHQRPQCAGELRAHRYGDRDWQTPVIPIGDAGSALILSSVMPTVVPERYPGTIYVGAKRYSFMGKAPSGTYWYRNVQSEDPTDIVYGRVYDDLKSLTQKNATRLQRGEPGNYTVA